MKILPIAAACLLALSACSGPSAGSSDDDAVYSLVLQRAEGYDNCAISADPELAKQIIDSGDLGLIKRGIKRFTGETEKAIADFNAPGDKGFAASLKRVNRTKKGDTRYRLSKIGYNEARTLAVVYESDYMNPDLGHSSYLFLKKDEGGWSLESEVMK